MLTQTDIEILSAQTITTLAEWWCALNSWEWPVELPNEETEEQYSAFMLKVGGAGVGHTRRSEVMAWIDGRVTQKFISRAWNKDMSDEEFNVFWRGNYEGDTEARKEYQVYLTNRSAQRQAEQWPNEISG